MTSPADYTMSELVWLIIHGSQMTRETASKEFDRRMGSAPKQIVSSDDDRDLLDHLLKINFVNCSGGAKTAIRRAFEMPTSINEEAIHALCVALLRERRRSDRVAAVT